jgi:tetratricopeptide (TPR) repeat protein
LHALKACLVFAALRGLTGRMWPSAAVAALFAVHPINVESVAWIAERKNVLSTSFWLLAMCAYARHARHPQGRWMWIVAACMALGLMAKPMLVTLPCGLLLLDVWPLRRHETTSWARLVGEKSALWLLSAASSATTLLAAAHDHALTDAGSLSVGERSTNAVLGYAAYLQNLAWPSHLAVLYPLRSHYPAGQILSASLLLAGCTVLCLALRKRQPSLLIGWLWFLGILVPVSSVFQVGAQAYADRFTYVPQLGLFWAVVWMACALPRPVVRWMPQVAATAVVVLALCTLRQVGYWTDTATLFEYTLRVTPRNGIALAIAGMGRSRQGDYPEAIAYFREAGRFLPSNAEIRWRLGEALTHTGENAEALHHLRAAVALDPRDETARRNLVVLLVNQGLVDEAAKLIPH